MSRWQPLFVVLAVLVVAVGVVVVVATGSGPSTGAPLPTSTTATTQVLTVDSGCRLGAGPTSLATVPSAVTARVNAAWERIETWLAANAPVSAASLRPPASTSAIVAAQRSVGQRFPPALVASLRRHDGVGQDVADAFTFPPFMHPLPVDRIAAEATVMCEVLVDLGRDGNVGGWWHGRYIPVASDYGGDLLFVDGDRLGRHYEADDVAYDGEYVGLLERTADWLAGGGEYEPVVIDGRLDWH